MASGVTLVPKNAQDIILVQYKLKKLSQNGPKMGKNGEKCQKWNFNLGYLEPIYVHFLHF